MQTREDTGVTNSDSFLHRFVHPRLAAVAIGGAGLWGVSFLVAAAGVGLRSTGRVVLAAQLFFLSSLVGLLGIFTLGCCALWLVGLRVRRLVAASGD
ncbi:hypothetical protein V5735_07420 (plasmid) [Haladaptatus sp. SPP-AMP-3]|uniref:hypothetical protein n=1 Tax=Haladaptatus sp. SPP-AMP-3 TaxID=3121295 RepID=UPI003C2BD96A